MSKMDDIRKKLDAQSTFVPSQNGPMGGTSIYDKYIDFIANHGEKESKIIDQKHQDNINMQLAKRIIDLNPDLPAAYVSKFAVMSENAHFSRNVPLVIEDAIKNGIKINLNIKAK